MAFERRRYPTHQRVGTVYGVLLRIIPGDFRLQVEVQRAPDSAGSPDVANAVTIATAGPFGRAGGLFADRRPNSSAIWHYRLRHVSPNLDAGPYTSWLNSAAYKLEPEELAAAEVGIDVYPLDRGIAMVDGQYAVRSSLGTGLDIVRDVTAAGQRMGRLAVQRGIWLRENFDVLPATAGWSTSGTVATLSLVNTVGVPTDGPNVLQAAGGLLQLLGEGDIPYNPTSLYRIKCRIRATVDSASSNRAFYLGFLTSKSDGSDGNNNSGAAYVGSAGTEIVVADGWRIFTGWFRGNTGGSMAYGPAASTDPRAPTNLNNDVVQMQPFLLANYPAGAGTVQLDWIKVEEWDEDAAQRLYNALEEGGGNLRSTTGIFEGSTSHKIYRHREEIQVNGADSDGDVAVSFTQTYQNAPLILFKGGQLVTFSNTLGTSVKQRQRVQALNVTASGFTSRTQITNPGATTAQTDDFASGNLCDAVGETAEVDLQPGGANDDTYTVNYRVSVTVDQHPTNFCTATLTVAIDTNDGSGWVERATFDYNASTLSGPPPFETSTSTFDTEAKAIVVSGLGTGDDIRVRAKSFSVSNGGTGSFALRGADAGGSNPDTRNGVLYNTASDTTESAIPSNGDNAVWVAQEVV